MDVFEAKLQLMNVAEFNPSFSTVAPMLAVLPLNLQLIIVGDAKFGDPLVIPSPPPIDAELFDSSQLTILGFVVPEELETRMPPPTKIFVPLALPSLITKPSIAV